MDPHYVLEETKRGIRSELGFYTDIASGEPTQAADHLSWQNFHYNHREAYRPWCTTNAESYDDAFASTSPGESAARVSQVMTAQLKIVDLPASGACCNHTITMHPTGRKQQFRNKPFSPVSGVYESVRHFLAR